MHILSFPFWMRQHVQHVQMVNTPRKCIRYRFSVNFISLEENNTFMARLKHIRKRLSSTGTLCVAMYESSAFMWQECMKTAHNVARTDEAVL